MKRTETHVVIGAGIAGCITAIMRRRAGYDVILLESSRAVSPDTHPVCTGGSNIVSENHSGAEYPFDPQSARDCLTGRVENERFLPDIIFGGKTYSRIIASRSMQEAGQDIVAQCRSNVAVLREHYARLCEQDPASMVFGDPAEVCAELSAPPQVNDVAAAFVTPQRGFNSAIASAVLDWELRSAGVDVREDWRVLNVTRLQDGSFRVRCTGPQDEPIELAADQVSICSATSALAMAKRLNPNLRLPPIYMALRQILYVDLPEGTDKDYTCLKLEDEYGGMLSPMNDTCGLAYYPPAAHIAISAVYPATYEMPDAYRRHLAQGHEESADRARFALERLRQFYPELRRATVLQSHLKIALNTVDDSRIRRNAGVIEVAPGCTATILLKWTMAVPNARRELEMALRRSADAGNIARDEVSFRLAKGTAPLWQTPPSWANDAVARTEQFRKHARNMRIPEEAATSFADSSAAVVAVPGAPRTAMAGHAPGSA